MKSKKTKPIIKSKKNFQAVYPLIIFCFSFLLYCQSINFKYTMFDDDSLLISNKDFFTEDGSIVKIFTTDAFMKNDRTFYRPMQNLSFLIDVKLSGGLNIRMFHFSNVLLFSLVAFSLYFLLLKFKISHFYAFLGTLFYAAHPLFASSAAWIPARGDLLLTFFSILTFIFWIQFINTQKYIALLVTWLCFTLAIFTKETAALLPVLFLLHFLFFSSKPDLDFKKVLLGILFLFTGLVWLFLRNLSIVGSDMNLSTQDFLFNLLAIPVSLAMFVIPYDFSTVPEFTYVKAIFGFISLILFVVCTVITTSQPRNKKIFYLLWFLLLLIPTFFAPSKEWDYLEHRFLLPFIGVLIFLLLHIQSLNRAKITSISIIIIAVFSVATIFKTKAFSTPVTFYEATKNNKNKPEVYHFLKGNIEQILGQYDKALKSYNMALKYNPNHIRALNNRGIIKQTIEDFEGALSDYNKVIDFEIQNYHIYKNRGTVRINLGDFAGAIDDFGLALEHEHNNEIYNLRGNAYLILEDAENALADFEQYYTNGYVEPDIFTLIGINFGQKNNFEKAIYCFTKAIETDSTNTIAYYNRAFAKYNSSDYVGALADCEKLLSIDSHYQNAHILKELIIKHGN